MPDCLPQVVLYTRRGCHLCDEMKAALTRLAQHTRFQLQEIDIDTDAELVRQFNDEVPVVFVQGKRSFMYRLDEKEFLGLLSG